VKRVEAGKDEVAVTLLYFPSSPSQMTAERQRNLTPALHFCRWTLRGPKPLDPSYPTAPVTLGEHLRKRRMDLGLTQRRVAKMLGANPWTYLLWEHDWTRPRPRFVPAIIQFLGYDPFPKGVTFPERLRAARRRLGLTHRRTWPASRPERGNRLRPRARSAGTVHARGPRPCPAAFAGLTVLVVKPSVSPRSRPSSTDRRIPGMIR
jgi:DNA-binding XRE family transcriptional regulator